MDVNVNLLDCISEITNRPICMDGENYLYLDTKENIESNILDEANILKREKELKIKRSASLSPRQARLILLSNNILDDIEAMLSTDRAMQIWWEYSLEIKRDNEHIINAGRLLGLSDEQLDTMFVDGAKL